MTNPISTADRFAARFLLILLPFFALVLLAALWSAALYQLSQERNAGIKETLAKSQFLTRTFAEHSIHMLHQVDHASQLFKLTSEALDNQLSLRDFTRKDGVLNHVLPPELNMVISVIDRHGTVIDSTQPFKPVNFSTQEFFKVLAARTTDSLFVNTLVTDPELHRWVIQLSRRFNARDGSFAGIVLFSIEPTYFIEDFDTAELGANGAVSFFSPEEKLSITRVSDQIVFSSLTDFLPLPESTPGEAMDQVRLQYPFDQIPRIFSSRALVEYSLMTVVGITEQEALGKYYDHRRIYFWSCTIASLLILGVAVMLTRQSYRLRKSVLVAREAQATLRAAADGSLDSFFILKSCRNAQRNIEDFVFADINQRGAKHLGLPREKIIGQRLCELRPLNRSAGFFDKYVKVAETGTPLEEEFEIPGINGEAQWLHHQIVAIPDGVAITTRDISARKKAELETRSNRIFLQSMIDYLPVLISVKSVRPENFGQMIVWNKAAEVITGYPADQVIGKKCGDIFPPDVVARHKEQDQKMLSNPMVINLDDEPFRRPDGAVHFLHTISVPLFDDKDHTEYILSISDDVTGRRQQELELHKNQAELAAANDASPLGLFRTDAKGNITYVNRTFEEITGLSLHQVGSEGWLKAIHPEDHQKLQDARNLLRRSRQPYQDVFRLTRHGNKLVWASIKIAPILIGAEIEGYAGSVDDVTARRESEMALRESEARLRTVADTLPAMVAYIDADERYRFHNLAYERDYGIDIRQERGKTVRETITPERYTFLEPYIRRVLKGEALSFEDEQIKEGVYYCREVLYIPQFAENSQRVVGFHVMRQDVTTQRLEERRLLQLTQLDPLTGLANRAGFQQKLNEAMNLSRNAHVPMALMYLDIDHFKPVNDTYGHDVGDALLKAFSQRLEQTLRASDTIARLGGDEFTIIMDKIGKLDDAAAIAEKVVGVMQAPFELDGIVVSVSVSIGMAFYQGREISADALIKQADVMLYQAKQAGRNTYRVAEFEA